MELLLWRWSTAVQVTSAVVPFALNGLPGRRKSVGEMPLFTFAVGIAELSAGGNPAVALQAADRSMYSTKSGQRTAVTA